MIVSEKTRSPFDDACFCHNFGAHHLLSCFVATADPPVRNSHTASLTNRFNCVIFYAHRYPWTTGQLASSKRALLIRHLARLLEVDSDEAIRTFRRKGCGGIISHTFCRSRP